MSNTTFDHVDDSNGVELHRLYQLYDFPDFVKKAAQEDVRQPEKLAHSVYADYMNKRYPCHNAASTWLSALYFQEKQAEYHPTVRKQVRQRLDGYVDYWGIKGAVDGLRSSHEEMNKSADANLPDEDFAYVWEDEAGNKQRNLRLKNAMETKVAAEWLHKYRDHLPFNDRNVIAKKILEKAARYGAGLAEFENFTQKQAGWGLCRPAEVVQMLNNRARLAKRAEHREGILKLAAAVSTSPEAALAPEQLTKLAHTVDMMDRAMSLVGQYSDVVPRPEDVIFKLTLKEAQAAVADTVALNSGTMYSKNELGKIKLADVQALFGSDFASEVSTGLNDVDPEKMAELVATMPRDDAELFDKLAGEAGVAPVQVKAASSHAGVPQEALAEAGAAY